MSRAESSTPAISLDQLVALNDEIAALVRAGVPLEQGLLQLGRDMPGRLGEIAHQLGRRMQNGESLERILDTNTPQFPPVWRAVVIAGLRCGRLASALEQVSTSGRRIAELRRAIGVSLIYPAVVVALAYLVFVIEVTYLAPKALAAYQHLTLLTDPVLNWLAWLGTTVKWWGWAIPLVVTSGLAWWSYRTDRAAYSGESSSAVRIGKLWPSMRQSLHDSRAATFAELLTLLIHHQTPLDEAVVLAAEASGDRALARAAATISSRLRSGQTLSGDEANLLHFPPLLRWLIASGLPTARLSQTLARTAQRYRQRAARAANFATFSLPLAVTAIVGGTATLVEGLVVFGPIWRFLYDLGK